MGSAAAFRMLENEGNRPLDASDIQSFEHGQQDCVD